MRHHGHERRQEAAASQRSLRKGWAASRGRQGHPRWDIHREEPAEGRQRPQGNTVQARPESPGQGTGRQDLAGSVCTRPQGARPSVGDALIPAGVPAAPPGLSQQSSVTADTETSLWQKRQGGGVAGGGGDSQGGVTAGGGDSRGGDSRVG